MPVRSLSSSVLKWPDRESVINVFTKWVHTAAHEHPEVVRIGYFGSCARGVGWGVGSDLDIIIITRTATESFERRSSLWNMTALPVPSDLVQYSEQEWKGMINSKFRSMIHHEACWVFPEHELLSINGLV